MDKSVPLDTYLNGQGEERRAEPWWTFSGNFLNSDSVGLQRNWGSLVKLSSLISDGVARLGTFPFFFFFFYSRFVGSCPLTASQPLFINKHHKPTCYIVLRSKHIWLTFVEFCNFLRLISFPIWQPPGSVRLLICKACKTAREITWSLRHNFFGSPNLLTFFASSCILTNSGILFSTYPAKLTQ